MAELPFILMHPKPEEEENPIFVERSPSKTDRATQNDNADDTTPNLIQLDG